MVSYAPVDKIMYPLPIKIKIYKVHFIIPHVKTRSLLILDKLRVMVRDQWPNVNLKFFSLTGESFLFY